MKKLLIVITWLLSSSALAQKSLPLSGNFRNDDRVFDLTEEAQKALFVKMKGDFIMPSKAFIFHLTKEDAATLKQEEIMVILNNDDIYFSNLNGLVTLNLRTVAPSQPNLFMEESEVDHKHNKVMETLRKPRKTDTLDYNTFRSPNDFRSTKQWINLLDRKDSILLLGQGCAETPTPSSYVYYFFDRKAIGELAHEQMQSVANLFYLSGSEEWSKTQWRKWYERTINGSVYKFSENNFINYD